jgi:hypothetical protein
MSDRATAPPPLYNGVVTNLEKTLAAGELVGLDEELRSMRSYVSDYARTHGEEFEKVLKGMRLIMQIVLAQHRMSAGMLTDSYAALEAATREFREAFKKPELDDL